MGRGCWRRQLMREHCIRARRNRRYKATTDSKHSMPVADNLLARNFTPAAPNRVWTGDITYIHTAEGCLNRAFVLNLFNREIVGWSIKPRMTADIVTDAPVRFLENWISPHADQQPEAA